MQIIRTRSVPPYLATETPKECKERKVSVQEYINRKIRMLERDFLIPLTAEEYSHMKSLKTEGDVDRYAHDLILNKL